MKKDFSQIKFSAHELGNFDLLIDGVFKILSEQLGFIQPGLALYDDKSKSLRFVKVKSHKKVNPLLKKLLGRSINDFLFPVVNKNNLLVKSFFSEKIIVTSSVHGLAVPVMPRSITSAVDRLIKVKSLTIVPIVFQKQSIGVFAIGSKKFKHLPKKIEVLLENFSNYVGKYIAELWEVEKLNNSLEKNKEERLLELDKDFLKNVSFLLSGIAEVNNLDDSKRLEIKENIQYLHSLVLIHEGVNSEKS